MKNLDMVKVRLVPDYKLHSTEVIDSPEKAFDGFSGVVDNIDIENDTVRVIISMMGRDTPLELGLDQVESAVD